MGSSNYLPRVIDARLSEALKISPIVVLDGPRAVGKTTTAQREAKSVIRFPDDLPLIAVNAADTLAGLEAPVLIDEWQLAGVDVLWTLKRIVDDDPTPGRFILAGSVEPASYGPTYPLTGRAVRIVMHPMTVSELRGHGDRPSLLSELAAGELPRASVGGYEAFSTAQLFATGFPGAREQVDPSMFLNGYASLVSQRAGEEGRDSSRLLKTLAVLGVLSAQAVPDQRIWESADVNKATWKAYEDLLDRIHLSDALTAFSSNALKRLTNYPKRFLSDTALALALANITKEDVERDASLIGRYFESFVVQQLRPHAVSLGGRLSHLRTTAGEREVDVIIELGTRIFGLEVKAGSKPGGDDARHLQWLQRELGADLTLSIVVHTGPDMYPIADKIWAVPASAL